jgi:hypothetical protein
MPAHCGPLRQECLDGLAAVNGRTIPNDQQFALDVREQVLEKGDHRITIKRLLLHHQGELTFWRDGADHRQVVASQVAV